MVREKLTEARAILQTLHDCLEGVERDMAGQVIDTWDEASLPEWVSEPVVQANGAGVFVNLHLFDCGPFEKGDKVRVYVEKLPTVKENP